MLSIFQYLEWMKLKRRKILKNSKIDLYYMPFMQVELNGI